MLSSLDHHAYGIAGISAHVVPKLLSELEKTGFHAKGNPDFRLERFELMGIAEAQALKEAAGRTAVTGGKKIFVISAQGVTREAQNALLKVLEEPPPNTHFFLVTPSFDTLLPTLRSRLFLLSPAAIDYSSSTRALEFLRCAVPARLTMVQCMLKELEEATGKADVISFFDELERTLAAEKKTGKADALAELLETKKYARDRAPSFKLLLEHLALVLPQMK